MKGTLADCDRELKRLLQERRSAEGVVYVQLSREIDRWLDYRASLREK